MICQKPTVAALLSFFFLGSGMAAESPRRLEVFDVRSFAEERAEAWAVLPPAPCMRGWGIPSYEGYGWVSPDHSERGAIHFEGGDEKPDEGLKALESAIRALIAKDSWNNTRNTLTTDGGWMTVVQTPEVLDRIRSFLRRMETLAQRQLCLDLAVVPPEALDEVAPGWSRIGASPWLAGDILERAVLASKGRAGVFSSRVRRGVPTVLQPRRVSRHLVDFEVNQTGVIPVINPLVASVLHGTFTEAVVHGSPSGAWYRLDLVLGQTRSPGKGTLRSVYKAKIELLRQQQTRVGTSVVVPRGRTAIVGAWTATGAGRKRDSSGSPARFVTLVRVTPCEDPDPAEGEGDETFAVDAGVLVEPPPDHELMISGTEGDYEAAISFSEEVEEEDVASLPAEVLDEKIRQAIPERAREAARVWRRGGTVVLRAPGVKPAEVRRSLDELARKRSRTLQVNLLQATVAPGLLAETAAKGTILDDAWLDTLEKQEGFRARVHSVAGASASLASVLSRNYLADIEKVSGGTGVEIVEVADPAISQVGEGLIFNVKASLVPGTGWAEIHVQGEAARTPSLERKARARSESTVDVRTDDSDTAKIEATGEWVELDLPEEDSDQWEHMVTVPLGKPVLLNALPVADGSGKVRALVVVVHAFEIGTDEQSE